MNLCGENCKSLKRGRQEKGNNQRSYLTMTPLNHTEHQHGLLLQRVKQGMHTLVETSSSLSRLKTHSTGGKSRLVLEP